MQKEFFTILPGIIKTYVTNSELLPPFKKSLFSKYDVLWLTFVFVNTDETAACWFKTWFDSPYYHLLYGNRDQKEAEEFIRKLVGFLSPPSNSKVLDLACGKGRHSIELHKYKLDVTGVDLSESSIEQAKKMETDGLTFLVHDMRYPFAINYFDFAFNLFTSFGYFSSQRENARVVSSVKSELKKGGIFVIDFLNSCLVKNVVEKTNSGNLETGGILFHWKKRIENEIVFKDIFFEAGNKRYFFTESVQLLQLKNFEELLSPYFVIEHVFGDYNLSKFEEQSSPRLILIARKK